MSDIVERAESPFNRPPLAERIEQAKAHMHGYRQHNETLWAHQRFALTVGELLDAAEAGLKAADEITRLRAEAANLRTVMVAAAEEIAAHWDAHCDAEGYGPVNLQRRLEAGIPSEYGYTAGAFAELRAERDRLRAALSQPVPAGWQPIETAQKDQGCLIGWVEGCVRFIQWGKTSHVPMYGWCLADQGPEDFDLCNPTRWMPLPAAPQPGAQDG